eukprot:COSAG05_NODE_207_length_14113_cov_13.452119_5_plen_286_part_00
MSVLRAPLPYVAVALLVVAVDAQLVTPFEAKGCPIKTFGARAKRINAACCTPQGSCPPGRPPRACSLRCALEFVPFYDGCKPVISEIFDGIDKKQDGHAQFFDQLFDECSKGAPRSPTSSIALSMYVKGLRERHCVVDLSSVTHKAQSNGRRQLQLPPGAITSCMNVKAFNEHVAKINAACCPHGATSCPGGVPLACDGECALQLPFFYKECNVMMKIVLGATLGKKLHKVSLECQQQDTHALILAISKAQCTPNRCGDGKVAGGEQCDDAKKNSDSKPNACRRG